MLDLLFKIYIIDAYKKYNPHKTKHNKTKQTRRVALWRMIRRSKAPPFRFLPGDYLVEERQSGKCESDGYPSIKHPHYDSE